MPAHEEVDRFWRDYERLTPEQQQAFLSTVRKFVADLRAGRQFRKGLRVKAVRGTDGAYEMTWADNGRATFQDGAPAHTADDLRPQPPLPSWLRSKASSERGASVRQRQSSGKPGRLPVPSARSGM